MNSRLRAIYLSGLLRGSYSLGRIFFTSFLSSPFNQTPLVDDDRLDPVEYAADVFDLAKKRAVDRLSQFRYGFAGTPARPR
jgi:hypothetical protein